MRSQSITSTTLNFDFLVPAIIIIVGVLFLGLLGYLVILRAYRKFKDNVLKEKGLNLVYYEIKLPQNNDIEIKAAEQLYSGLLSISEKLKGFNKYIKARSFISFEMVAFKETIKFYVVCPKKISSLVDRQINGNYPTAEINIVKEYNLFPDDDSHVAYTVLTLDKDSKYPIQTYEELPVDTLSTLSDAFSKLQDNEAAAFQVIITPADSEWRNNTKSYVTKMKEPPPAKEGETPKPKKEDEGLNFIDQKIQKPVFNVCARLIVISDDKFSADTHLNNMLSSFEPFTKIGSNKIKKVPSEGLKNIISEFIYRIPRDTMILNTAELATLFHFPNKNIKTPYIKWQLSKRLPAPDFVNNTFQKDYMYVGRNTYRGQFREIFMKPEDRLRHFYVIGQTGTGKSGFMSGMMIRDMKMGHGCGYIDPHGTDAEKLLAQVPPERIEDVVIVDPADLERPVGINMLEFNTEEQRTLAINEMLNIFDTLYNLKVTGGPMFEQYFRYAILLLTEDTESGATLLEVPRIFADEGYRAYKLSKCKSQETIDFWKKQAEQAGGDVSLKNVTPYVTSKMASFLSNAYLRPIVAQQYSTIKFREIMDNKKILIVKLSKGKIGDFNASLLGMVLVGKLLVGALERESLPEAQRTPFYLYVDEFQNFLTDGIVTILSEARKYKLALTLGHQFLGQLIREGNNTKIKDAVFGNVGNKAIMRVGEEDSPFLRKVVGEDLVEEKDLQQVENFSFYLKMLTEGKPTPAFSCRSFYGDSPYDMISQPNQEIAEVARKISRLKYGKDRNIVENEIKLRGTFVKEKDKDDKKDSLFGGLGF